MLWETPHSGDHSAAALAIVWNADRTGILLIKRRDIPVWVLPGGGIEKGETPSQAACREVWEETGVFSSTTRPLAYFTPVNRLSYPTFLLECIWNRGTPGPTEESKEAAFFPLEALPSPLFFIHRDWIKEALFWGQGEMHNEDASEGGAASKRNGWFSRPLHEVTYAKVFCYFFRHPSWVIKVLIQRWKMRQERKKTR